MGRQWFVITAAVVVLVGVLLLVMRRRPGVIVISSVLVVRLDRGGAGGVAPGSILYWYKLWQTVVVRSGSASSLIVSG